jgi:hypothetical protein
MRVFGAMRIKPLRLSGVRNCTPGPPY